ncbi:MAG: N-acetyl-D-glucosamine kinase [Prosthecobacter sp.]|nr:N-acetyl-D-glucosamine kinase [Prosthecobacter sp.]
MVRAPYQNSDLNSMRNSEDQRQLLAQAVLHVRSHRATSRRTLADVMRLSPTTAGQYVDHLMAEGLLHEQGLEKGPMGRPKRVLHTRGAAGWFAGIEFNAERIQAVRVDFSGTKTDGRIISLSESATPKAVITEISRLINALAQEAEGTLFGIGVGVPGIVDPVAGIARDYAFIKGWKEVPLARLLHARYGVPVTLDNNLRAIALAERWFGGAGELTDYVILGPRSGFGIAIVIGGRIVTGAEHAAGEIGRWPWAAGGELHDALSSPAVWRRLTGKTKRAGLPADLHGALAALVDQRDDTRAAIVTDYARVLGSLHLLLDTHSYFLHGPLTALGEAFCADITECIRSVVPSLRDKPPRLLRSQLGDDAGALGAASVAMEAWAP